MSIDQWQNFGVLVGGASAALTGLLFVAVSLNLGRIAASPLLREAAAKTLIVLLTPLLIAILLAIPGQATWVLGVELIAIGLLTGDVSIIVREDPEVSTSTDGHVSTGLSRQALQRLH
jgi:modulator of FtsH protease